MPYDHGRPLNPTDGDFVWLLTVDYGGEILRWSSRDVEVEDLPQGGQILPGLETRDVTQAIALDGAGRGKAMTFELFFPMDVASLEARGGRLAGADGELAMLPTENGTGTWSDRYVVLRGYVSRPEYGDFEEPVTFSLSPYDTDDRAVIPAATYRVDSDTWPDSKDEYRGLVYPAPFGKPGVLTDGGRVPGSPALSVDGATGVDGDGNTAFLTSKLLVAWGKVEATQAVIWYERHPGSNFWGTTTVDLTEEEDGLGQLCTVADISGSPAAVKYVKKWGVDWRHGYAKLMADGEPIRTMADMCRWLLRSSSVPVDFGRLSSGLAALDSVRVDGYIDETTTPMAWISDRVLGSFPVSREDGAEGVALRAIRYAAEPRDAVADLVVGSDDRRQVVRDDRVKVTDDGRYSEVRVRWGLHQPAGIYAKLTVVRRDIDGASTAVSERASAGIIPSVARVKEVELPDCYDEGTALVVARWLAWLDGQPKRSVDLVADADIFGHLQRYDIVTFTDAGIHLTNVPCMVEAVSRGDGPTMDIRLLLLR